MVARRAHVVHAGGLGRRLSPRARVPGGGDDGVVSLQRLLQLPGGRCGPHQQPEVARPTIGMAWIAPRLQALRRQSRGGALARPRALGVPWFWIQGPRDAPTIEGASRLSPQPMADASRARTGGRDPRNTAMDGGCVRMGEPARCLRPRTRAPRAVVCVPRPAASARAGAALVPTEATGLPPGARRSRLSRCSKPRRGLRTPRCIRPRTPPRGPVPSDDDVDEVEHRTAAPRPAVPPNERIALLVDGAGVEDRAPAESIGSHGHVTVPRDVRVLRFLIGPRAFWVPM